MTLVLRVCEEWQALYRVQSSCYDLFFLPEPSACVPPVSAADLRSTPGLRRQVSALGSSRPVEGEGEGSGRGREREGGAARDAPGGTARAGLLPGRRGGGSSSGAHRPRALSALSGVCR